VTHGTRATYKRFHCRCLPCKAAEAAYRQALRRLQAQGTRPLGSLIDAATTRQLVKGMRIEGFTFAEIARRLGVKCQRFRLYTDQVTQRKYLQVRRLYRQQVADASPDESV
jgi:chorismate-pyruvate lyase